jgi:hypothetical protein
MMSFEDVEQLLAGIGQAPCPKYQLGIGSETSTPTIGMHATQPKTLRGSREAHMSFPDHLENNFLF